jgi:hypothetical protein
MMAKKNSELLGPHIVTEDLWFYENPKGLNIVHDIRLESGQYVRTDQIIIPWRQVVAAVRRYEAQKA